MEMEQLLKKFYEGVSTPEEERFLKDYFLNEKNVEARWQTDRELFRRLYGEQIQVPEGVSGRLAETIRQMDASSRHSQRRRQLWLYRISSVAAVALLCIGLFFTTREPAKPSPADTFNNPEEAAVVAGQALAFLSTQLNHGLNQVADAEQKIETVNRILNKYLKE